VAVYATSDEARLEVIRAVHPVEAPITGRVAASKLSLGLDVEAGEVLVELDAQEQRLALREAQSRRESFSRQVEALRRQAAAQEQAQQEDRQSARAELEEAKARQREGEAAARQAAEKLDRLGRLDRGGVGEQELLDARAEADKARASAEALVWAATRLESELKTRESDRQSELEELRTEVARVEGEMAASSDAIERLQYEIDQRAIRAPVAGRLGEVGEVRIGAFVAEGTKLAAVVPRDQEVMLVADFEPAAAAGRIRAGQRAWLNLHGFPSIQYGSVPATVERVGSEIRDGRIRVELAVKPDRDSTIPYEHGLPGTVEVEVERASPAVLVLRAAGQLLASPKPSRPLPRSAEEAK
jgi:membrane fusion protein (multidrug efflux system)